MNCIIYIKNSNTISHFIKNAIKRENNFIGDNRKIYGIKLSLFDFAWTEDKINPIYNEENNIIGWDKTVDQINKIDTDDFEIKGTNSNDFKAAIKIRNELAKLSYNQVDNYVENNVTDLLSAKEYIKKLSKIVLAIIKMQDK